MKFKDIAKRVRNRIQRAGQGLTDRGKEAGRSVRSIIGTFSDEYIESAFRKARETIAPDRDFLPADFQLRQSYWPRRIYERMVPVSHVFRMGMRYKREHLEDFMPISPDHYIGRGSYKFVYSLPWKMVLKISRQVLPSDPIFGSMFREVDQRPEQFLSQEELALYDFLSEGKRKGSRDRLWFQFLRLGMERYHYAKVREALPDLVLPTKFFMGVRYRRKPFGKGHYESIRPMDSQIMLVGKHLKEFASAAVHSEQNKLMSRFFPRWDFEFEVGRFGRVKKKVLLKITEDFRRLIEYTETLAREEKLILDIHTENLIITLPEFELKIFDFHLFDEHLYESTAGLASPEQDHVAVLERFVESLDLQ